MKKIMTFLLLILLIVNYGSSQNVAINTDGSNANSDAILHLKSTSKGLLIPSMTSTQRTAISNVSDGLMVYDTQTNSFWYRDSGAWNEIVSGDIDLTTIEDIDGNTKIQVEESSNDNQIRFDIDGAEQLIIKENTNGQLMFDLTQISGNIFMGQDAGLNTAYSFPDGFNNSFFGNLSGKGNTSGSYNSCFGKSAGTANTGGDWNTLLGAQAALALTSGSSNTMIGFASGNAQTSGDQNTFVGTGAGGQRTGGSDNTCIGYRAGRNSVSGSGNIYIGNLAGSQASGDDKLYIDNSTTNSPLIYGDFANDELEFNGKVGISRNPGTNNLEVNGTASKSSSGDWLANSDARLKKNITPLPSENVLQKLLQLKGVTYEWNDDKTGNKRPEGIQYGFTAQNIQEVYPELVSEDNLGYLQTAYGTYDAMYIESIRALLNRIETLETKLEKMEQLEARLNLLESANNLNVSK